MIVFLNLIKTVFSNFNLQKYKTFVNLINLNTFRTTVVKSAYIKNILTN